MNNVSEKAFKHWIYWPIVPNLLSTAPIGSLVARQWRNPAFWIDWAYKVTKPRFNLFIRVGVWSGETGKQDEAIAELSKAIEKHDPACPGIRKKGKDLLFIENYNDAFEGLQQMPQHWSTIASACMAGGLSIRVRQKWPSLISTMPLKIIVEDHSLEARRALKGMHFQLKEYDKAFLNWNYLSMKI